MAQHRDQLPAKRFREIDTTASTASNISPLTKTIRIPSCSDYISMTWKRVYPPVKGITGHCWTLPGGWVDHEDVRSKTEPTTCDITIGLGDENGQRY